MNKWRNDQRCGTQYPLSDGSKAECNPLSREPCCSPHGYCGNTPAHCTCNECIYYKLEPIGMSLLINTIWRFTTERKPLTPVGNFLGTFQVPRTFSFSKSSITVLVNTYSKYHYTRESYCMNSRPSMLLQLILSTPTIVRIHSHNHSPGSPPTLLTPQKLQLTSQTPNSPTLQSPLSN